MNVLPFIFQSLYFHSSLGLSPLFSPPFPQSPISGIWGHLLSTWTKLSKLQCSNGSYMRHELGLFKMCNASSFWWLMVSCVTEMCNSIFLAIREHLIIREYLIYLFILGMMWGVQSCTGEPVFAKVSDIFWRTVCCGRDKTDECEEIVERFNFH